ncbi:hypothetical protein N5923_04185 [Erwiniaceae bacterium BAC15a-03b]|uniref:Uncharacterized protein n=1 Tax=Winslowiella arboricola TaxID=2978220 RepID=A0A9J6PPQ8_9GAMM|nr:hypothetical protein [Winslowiella arboricola]MCU5773376.1 hypothetical protein [Winslowiella arboricola]MCU5776700.1 hypothetical protein [Winslowiella arboricola]
MLNPDYQGEKIHPFIVTVYWFSLRPLRLATYWHLETVVARDQSEKQAGLSTASAEPAITQGDSADSAAKKVK